MKRRVMQPLGDRVIVERIPEAVRSVGGIEFPDQAKEKPQEGVVRAVGQGRWEPGVGYMPIQLKVGHRVLFAKFTGTVLKIDGEEVLVFREDELLMVDTGEVVDIVDAEMPPKEVGKGEGLTYFSRIHKPEEFPSPDPDEITDEDEDQKKEPTV